MGKVLAHSAQRKGRQITRRQITRWQITRWQITGASGGSRILNEQDFSPEAEAM